MYVNFCFTIVILYNLVLLSSCDPPNQNENGGTTVSIADEEKSLSTAKEGTVVTSSTSTARGINKFARISQKVQQQVQQQAVKTVRKINENVPDSLKKYGDLPFDLLEKLSAKQTTSEEKLQALSETILDAIRRGIHESTGIKPLDQEMGMGTYVCGGHGRAADFTTIRHGSTKAEKSIDGFIDLRVIYIFGDLKFYYEKFYVRAAGAIKLEGRMDLQFGDNELEVILRVPTFKNVVAQYTTDRCLVRLIDLNASVLKYKYHNLAAKSHIRRGMITAKMDDYFKTHEDVLKQRFESQAIDEVIETLKKTGSLVCKDEQLEELIKRKKGPQTGSERSPSFKRHCL